MVKKIKQRPRRLFYDDVSKRYFYLINNKKTFIKAPKDMGAKAIAKVNIQNVLQVPVRKKAIRPRTSIKPITNQQVITKLVPIAPISQNLTDKKYDIYKTKDDFEKRLTKMEEKQKLEDTKVEEKKGGIFNPTKAPKPTSGNVLKNAYNMFKQRREDDKILKQQLKEQADADKKAVNKGFVETNPDPDEEDEGDISTETTGLFGKVGQLFTTKKKKTKTAGLKTINVQDFITFAEGSSTYPVFPDFEYFEKQVFPNLTGYYKPKKDTYYQARDLYNKMKTTQPPTNTTPIEELKSEAEIPIGIVRTGNITTFGTGISTFYKLNGYGEYENDDDGIFNDELQEIFKDKMNKFLPVIASDKMDTLLPLVNRDTKKFGWIQNTEPSGSGGRHWVAYFIDVPNMEVNYYDSLVENDGIPPKESMKGLKKIVDKIHPEYYLKFKYSTIRDQNPSSKNCGYFALKFIMDRYRNVPFKTASGYDKVYNDYGEGEEMIKRFKKYL
jgi:hypothetical protein